MNLDGVTPAAIRRELERFGFEAVDDLSRTGTTWAAVSGPDDKPTVLVPREEDVDVRGYRETLASAVERLSWISDLSVPAVVERLLAFRDRLQLRIVHSVTARHTLGIEDAPDVVKGFSDVIKSGVRTEVDGARADHRSGASDKYRATLKTIELLAPASGSFRLIAVSADLPQFHLHTDELTSAARGALASALRSLAALTEATVEVVNNEAGLDGLVDAGVSVQMLRAVQDLGSFTTTSGLTLEFSGEWDPTLGPPPLSARPVVLGDREIALAKQLRPKLQRQYRPRPDFPLHGWVTETKAPALDLAGHPSGSVIVKAEIRGKETLVGVDLDPDTFPLVTAGASEIHATGTLERIAGRWRLSDVRSVAIDRKAR